MNDISTKTLIEDLHDIAETITRTGIPYSGAHTFTAAAVALEEATATIERMQITYARLNMARIHALKSDRELSQQVADSHGRRTDEVMEAFLARSAATAIRTAALEEMADTMTVPAPTHGPEETSVTLDRVKADLEAHITTLDLARASGLVLTYGHIQELIRTTITLIDDPIDTLQKVKEAAWWEGALAAQEHIYRDNPMEPLPDSPYNPTETAPTNV
jgi:hypothetical protein